MSRTRATQIIGSGQQAGGPGIDTREGVFSEGASEFSLTRALMFAMGHVVCDTWQQLRQASAWTATGHGGGGSGVGDGVTTPLGGTA